MSKPTLEDNQALTSDSSVYSASKTNTIAPTHLAQAEQTVSHSANIDESLRHKVRNSWRKFFYCGFILLFLGIFITGVIILKQNNSAVDKESQFAANSHGDPIDPQLASDKERKEEINFETDASRHFSSVYTIYYQNQSDNYVEALAEAEKIINEHDDDIDLAFYLKLQYALFRAEYGHDYTGALMLLDTLTNTQMSKQRQSSYYSAYFTVYMFSGDTEQANIYGKKIADLQKEE